MNKQIKLAKRPIGMPTADTWILETNEIPPIKNGEFLIKQSYISLDPAMRGWLNDVPSYIPPVDIGEVMRARSIGTVTASKHPDFSVGDTVTGLGGVQQYLATNGQGFYKIDTTVAPASLYMGALGPTGMTAYFGILEIGAIKAGETIFVSGAAGAVGSIVGQIAKIKGCKVIGTAGGAAKCKYVIEQLGFDACIDYKRENVAKSLKVAAPTGIDVYFDNVGGKILEIALDQIRKNARVVLCGAISQYNSTEAIKGPANYLSLIIKRARMEGIIVLDYINDFGKAAKEMGQWIAQGKLKSKVDIYQNIENFYPTFQRLFNGDKLGKLVLKVN